MPGPFSIRAARKSRGWSQQELADRLRVAQTTVSALERERVPQAIVGALEDALADPRLLLGLSENDRGELREAFAEHLAPALAAAFAVDAGGGGR